MSIDFGTDIYEEPLVSKSFLPEDSGELSLRPTLREYIGQQKAKENLSVFIEAAAAGRSLWTMCCSTAPGPGQTTLAGIIAAEMGVNIRITSGPAIEKPGDLAALLTNLSENDILFVDEIHRLNRSVEEILYPAMEDYAIDIIIGKGPPPTPSGWTCRSLPLSEPPPGPGSCPLHCGTASASPCGWSCTPRRNWP